MWGHVATQRSERGLESDHRGLDGFFCSLTGTAFATVIINSMMAVFLGRSMAAATI